MEKNNKDSKRFVSDFYFQTFFPFLFVHAFLIFDISQFTNKKYLLKRFDHLFCFLSSSSSFSSFVSTRVECESKTSVRLCEYEIHFIVDIGCGHLLCWHRILILPWHQWADRNRSASGFLLGLHGSIRFICIRKCYVDNGDTFD